MHYGPGMIRSPGRPMRPRLLIVVLALLAAACGDGGAPQGAASPTGTGARAGLAPDGPTITVGSFNFPESQILANIYAQALDAAGYPVDLRLNIGAREVVQPAMERGDIDLIPEYTGNALLFQRQEGDVELRDEREVYDALQGEYAQDGLVAFEMASAQDVDGLAVTRETAEEHGLETISDIKDKFPGTFRFGAGPECEERLSCLRGYREIYGLTPEEFEFVPLDVAGPITVEALRSGEVDGANLFTTQGVVAANDFVLLEDDRSMQLPQNIVPVTTKEILDAYGDDLRSLVDAITAELTTEGLTELNRRVEVDQDDPAVVAGDWLREHGFL